MEFGEEKEKDGDGTVDRISFRDETQRSKTKEREFKSRCAKGCAGDQRWTDQGKTERRIRARGRIEEAEGGRCWKKWTAAPRPTKATRQRLGLGRQRVGSVCLANSAGDWRPATAVDPWKSQQQPPFLGWAVSSPPLVLLAGRVSFVIRSTRLGRTPPVGWEVLGTPSHRVSLRKTSQVLA